jgi:AcrR family transcriptional regulator
VARQRATVALAGIVASVGAVDDDDTTTRILDATSTLLAEYGLRRWSVDDVALLAGVGRTTVYRKFPGRDDLTHAVLARELRWTLAAIAASSRGHGRLEDQIVAGAVAALSALRSSLVERLLRSDPATFLPFLTTGAAPLVALARDTLAAQLCASRPSIDRQRARELAEVAVRLGLSFILTRDTTIPIDDEDALRESVRRIVRPVLGARA